LAFSQLFIQDVSYVVVHKYRSGGALMHLKLHVAAKMRPNERDKRSNANLAL
jgi:hypothetical protein